MTLLPILITSATIAYTVFFPDEKRKSSSSSLEVSNENDNNHSFWWGGWGNNNNNNENHSFSSRPSSSSSSSLSSRGSFLLGICVGASLAWMISYEAKRRRLWETVRLQFLSWLYDGSPSIQPRDAGSSNNTDDQDSPRQRPQRLVDKFRIPSLMTNLTGTPIPQTTDTESDNNDFCGTHLEYLSPDWTLASGLYVDVLTLPSGSELVPSRANGVEFYFVIKGSGTYSRNGETFSISAGYGFLSDPGTMRGFLVGRMSSSLVLLRATDTPFYAEQSTARMQNNSLTSALSLVSAGLTKIQTMMEESKTAANNIAPTSTSRSGTSGAANSLDQ